MEDAAGLCIRVKFPAALPCSLARSINLHLSSSTPEHQKHLSSLEFIFLHLWSPSVKMPRLPDGQIQTAQNAFDAFITRENLHPEDHAALLRFLQHQVPMNLNTDEVRDPIPDQIQRIRQVYRTKREIQQMFGDSFVFTHLHQIGILLFGQRLTQLGVRESKTNLSLLEPFLARCKSSAVASLESNYQANSVFLVLQRSTAIPPDVDLPTNPPQPQGKEVPRNKAASRAVRNYTLTTCTGDF